MADMRKVIIDVEETGYHGTFFIRRSRPIEERLEIAAIRQRIADNEQGFPILSYDSHEETT